MQPKGVAPASNPGLLPAIKNETKGLTPPIIVGEETPNEADEEYAQAFQETLAGKNNDVVRPIIPAQMSYETSWNRAMTKLGWGVAGVGALLLSGGAAVGSILTLPIAFILIPLAVKGVFMMRDTSSDNETSIKVGFVLTGVYGLTVLSLLAAIRSFEKMNSENAG